MVNSTTHIAFIECTFDTNWESLFGYPNETRKVEWSQYKALNDISEVALVDIGNTRRYYKFKKDSTVQIANNVLSFKSYEATDLAVDEAKQFPKKSRMDEF